MKKVGRPNKKIFILIYGDPSAETFDSLEEALTRVGGLRDDGSICDDYSDVLIYGAAECYEPVSPKVESRSVPLRKFEA